MFCYASRTGTKRNLAALREHGWGLLVSRAGAWRTEGFDRVALDNGAWADFQAGRTFDEDGYDRYLEWAEAQPHPFDWLALPDIVAGGIASLQLSLRYLNRGLSISPLVLIAVQDGMTPENIAPLVGSQVGVFLGGSTDWKIRTMAEWGRFCATRDIYYHVARVNSIARIALAASCGADSIDGSSASRYAVSLPKLAYAARQPDMLSPRFPL